jgi:NAD(P)H dehydrogenase (quinone)
LNPTAYENIIIEFNGSEQLSFPQIAKILTSVLKEPIKYISPEISEFESQMSKFGVPDHIIDILSTFSSAIEIGEFDQQSKIWKEFWEKQVLSDFLENAYR